MSFISSSQLASMRAQVLNHLLPDEAVIQENSFVSDGAGGGSLTWSAVSGGTVACRLDPLNTTSKMIMIDSGQETLHVEYQLTLPHDAPLAEDRRLVINGNTYEVLQLEVDHSWNVSKRAIVSEVR